MKKILFIFLILFWSVTKIYCSEWELIKGPNVNKYISALETYESTIYISLYEKLFKTVDFGKTWEEIYYKNNTSFPYIWNYGIVKTENELLVRLPLNSDSTLDQLSLSTNDGNSWEKAIKNVISSYVFWVSQVNNNLFSTFQTKINKYNISRLFKYNSILKEWIECIDSISVKKIINTPKTVLMTQNKLLIGTQISKYDGEVLKRPNIHIYDPLEQTIINIMDTTSDLWKSHINCFIEKDGMLFTGTSTGVYKSTDEGLTWIRESEGLHFKDSIYDYDFEIHRMMTFKNVIYAIATPPISSGDFYPTYTSLVYSTDNGENWKIAENFQMEWPQDFRVIGDKIILSSYYGGLFETDKTLTKKISLLNDTLNSGTVLDFWLVDNKLIASNYGKFLSATSDDGNLWESLINNSILQNVIATKIYMKDSLYFVNNNYQTFLVSKDAGKKYKYKNDLDGLKNTQVNSIYIDENNIVYVGTRFGIYFSTNKGDSWEKLTPSELDLSIQSIEKVGDLLFIGTTDYGIYKFNLIDKTVNQLTIPKKYSEITVKEVKYMKNKLYIGTKIYANSSEGITANGEGIFVSTDLGLTWEKRNAGLPDSCETVNIVQYGDYIFAGMSNYGGVYYSTNEGMNWLPLNRGYSGYTLNRLRVFGDYLYCATSTGLYKLNLKEWISGVDEIERKNYLYNYPPYPNPATDQVSTMIYWDLALDINSADIKIYDIYGKQVADKTSTTLEEQGPYYGKLTWNCHVVNPGVYLITINYGTEKKAIKVCVVN